MWRWNASESGGNQSHSVSTFPFTFHTFINFLSHFSIITLSPPYSSSLIKGISKELDQMVFRFRFHKCYDMHMYHILYAKSQRSELCITYWPTNVVKAVFQLLKSQEKNILRCALTAQGLGEKDVHDIQINKIHLCFGLF